MRRISEWLDRRFRWAVAATLVLTAALAVPFLTMPPEVSASTEPEGPVFDARDRIDERFVSSVYPIFFVIEDPAGDLLSVESMRQLHAAERAIRADAEIGPTLFSYFDPGSMTEIEGLVTIADLVDAALPGGLATASDEEVRRTASEIIDTLGPEAGVLGLSVESERGGDGLWTVPAVSLQVLADNEILGFGSTSINLGGGTETEEYARSVQSVMRDAAPGLSVYGVAIDVNLTSQEEGALAGPFIGLTVFAVLLIVGAAFRSYWVLAVVAAALGALMIWLKGLSNLVGLEDSLVLTLIVPIAMISFGVDFAFHSVGRYREQRQEGQAPRRAFVTGLAAVSGALLLALTSDVAAFLANLSSGIDSIVQFGWGAALALGGAYLLLGVMTPLVVARIEDRLGTGTPSRRGSAVAASLAAAGLSMASVLLMVFVLPWAGLVAYAVSLLVTLVIPIAWLGRRTDPVDHETAPPRPDRWAAPIGAGIAALARRRMLVVPLAMAVSAVAAVFAVNVPAEFDVEDFFSGDTDFVTSLELLDRHVGDRGGEPALIYVEGPLDEPAALAQLASRIEEVRGLDSDGFGMVDGEIRVGGGVLAVFDAVFASPTALEVIGSVGGVGITDGDGDGIPDTREQVLAVYEVGGDIGVPFDAERLALTPDNVRSAISAGPEGYATVFELGLVDSRSQEAVAAAMDELAPVVASISRDFDGAFVEATGSPFVRQESLEATNRALQVSLPIAVVLCLLVAGVFLRSVRFAVAAVVPILMTVAWLYAFMERTGYAINIVTATIAAVSIGIGIDFAIHYIARFREELARYGDRMVAVRVAGEGTGTALVASAVSSAVGFAILAFAPMPLFAAYGLLTTIMIVMAAVATLVVLPGLLVMLTTDREAARRPVESQTAVAVLPMVRVADPGPVEPVWVRGRDRTVP
jgi:uncharacterized protein